MIKTIHISKTFSDKKRHVQALTDINLSVARGDIYGLIGPDGAGKTTLFRILTTLILPDQGTATVAGHDIIRDYKVLRSKLGYMPGRFSLYQDLTVEENLRFYAKIFNTSIKENYNLIRDIYVQLEPFKDRRAGALSGGMKQKLALSCALIHKPEVLFLDEPTTGVDVVSRKEFWEMMHRLKKAGITIFVSTPYMDEASLCDRIALIQNGQILSESTPTEIIQGFKDDLYGIKTKKINKVRDVLLQMKNVVDAYTFGESLHVKIKKEMANEHDIIDHLTKYAIEDVDVKQIDATIEDCFMDLMKN